MPRSFLYPAEIMGDPVNSDYVNVTHGWRLLVNFSFSILSLAHCDAASGVVHLIIHKLVVYSF